MASYDAYPSGAGAERDLAEGASVSFGSTFSFPKEKVEEEAGETLLHHNVATLQVMLTRTQAALGFYDDFHLDDAPPSPAPA